MKSINNNKHKKKKAILLPKQNTHDLKLTAIPDLYNSAIKAYQSIDRAGENRWNKMMAESGTKKDKVDAAGLMILQNPQSSLKYFDMLVKWSFEQNQNFAIKACETLANVYIEHIFTEKTTLKSFVESVQQYIKAHKKHAQVTDADLIGFYLQNQMKQYYGQLLKSMQILLNCELTHIKKNTIKILSRLAKFKELRRTTLSLIINKLGDNDLQVVNQVTKSLKQQFYADIVSGEALLEEVERFLFRSKLRQKSQFYVINFLNTINIKYATEKSINRIFQIFYHFFSKFINSQQSATSDELCSRLFLNSIKGLNKIFSSLQTSKQEIRKNIENKIEEIYRVIHKTTSIKAKIQLLLFLFQTHTHIHHHLIDRFYRVLYDFLKDSNIIHCSLAEMFFDLVLVSIKQDQNKSRIMAMSKRLLQLCFNANSNFIITTLLMLDKIIQGNQGFKNMLFQAENFMGEEEQIQKYDPHKREPQFANAEKTCLWQLRAFCNHYHPTIRKFVKNILNQQPIEFEGSNPLLEFSLTSFVEKFSLKKQKKSDAWRMKVRRNIQKIRTSKYETLLQKPLDNFKQDQAFIKQYLQKRALIHQNKQKFQDIQQFADQVIEKEMDRLNPKDVDLSGSQADMLDQDDQAQKYSDQQLEGEEQQFEGQQFEDMQQMQEGSQDDDDEIDADMSDIDEEDEAGSQDKQFQDVFDEIEQQDSFPTKTKKIRKPQKPQFKRNGKNKHTNFKKNNFSQRRKK